MAWTNITNAAVAAGAAVSTALMTALRDNVTAVANRDAGAPKVLGANLDLIERVAISGSPSVIDFTFTPTDYDEIVFKFARIKPSANDGGLNLRTSTDGGSTFDDAGTAYRYVTQSVSAEATPTESLLGASVAAFIRIATDCGAAADEILSGSVSLFGPALTTDGYASLTWQTIHENSSGVAIMTNGSGQRGASADVDAVRFYWSGGANFQNLGTITAYGIRNN